MFVFASGLAFVFALVSVSVSVSLWGCGGASGPGVRSALVILNGHKHFTFSIFFTVPSD